MPRRLRLDCIALALALAPLALTSAACRAAYSATADRALALTAGPGEIRVFDSGSFSLAARLAVEGDPVALAARAGKNSGLVYALLARGGPRGELLALAMPNARVLARREIPFAPTALLAGPPPENADPAANAADAVFVAGQRDGGGRVLRLDPRSLRTEARAVVGLRPMALALAPEGRLVLADPSAHALDLLRAADLARRGQLTLAAAPSALVALPYGHKVFALCPSLGQLAAVDLAPFGILTYLPVGGQPQSLALKPDGGELYVSSLASGGRVTAVDTTANEVAATMTVGLAPVGMAVSPDNQWLYVANSGANTVDVISIEDRRVVAAVGVGARPTGLALGPGGALLFALDAGSSDLAVIRADSRSLLMLPPAPAAASQLLAVRY